MKLKKEQERAIEDAINILHRAGLSLYGQPEWIVDTHSHEVMGRYIPMVTQDYFIRFNIFIKKEFVEGN